MVASELPSEKTIILEKQKVVYGDSLRVLSKLQDRSIDLCITSPPYNIGVKYGTYDDRKTRVEYLAGLHQIFSQVKRVLTDEGSLFLNVGGTNLKPWLPFDVVYSLNDLFVLQNHIIWIKSISVDNVTRGHFKPINGHRFLNHTHENIFHFTKNGEVKLQRRAIGVPYMDKGNIAKKPAAIDLRCRGNCWFIPYETIQSRTQKGMHPAIFPQKLVEWCIKLSGYNNGTHVLDPFLGSGTTLVVAKRLGINGVGIEIDENYFNWACRRIAET